MIGGDCQSRCRPAGVLGATGAAAAHRCCRCARPSAALPFFRQHPPFPALSPLPATAGITVACPLLPPPPPLQAAQSHISVHNEARGVGGAGAAGGVRPPRAGSGQMPAIRAQLRTGQAPRTCPLGCTTGMRGRARSRQPHAAPPTPMSPCRCCRRRRPAQASATQRHPSFATSARPTLPACSGCLALTAWWACLAPASFCLPLLPAHSASRAGVRLAHARLRMPSVCGTGG